MLPSLTSFHVLPATVVITSKASASKISFGEPLLFSAINTVKAMVIDVDLKKPVLSNRIGGLSGPAIHPIAVRIIYELYEKINIPLIGVGGVEDWRDVIEFMLAGANAVQVGSVISIRGLKIFKEILNGIKIYLSRYGYKDIKDIVGLAHE